MERILTSAPVVDRKIEEESIDEFDDMDLYEGLDLTPS